MEQFLFVSKLVTFVFIDSVLGHDKKYKKYINYTEFRIRNSTQIK